MSEPISQKQWAVEKLSRAIAGAGVMTRGIAELVGVAVVAGLGGAPHKPGEYTIEFTATWAWTAEYFYESESIGTLDLGGHPFPESVNQRVREIETVNG